MHRIQSRVWLPIVVGLASVILITAWVMRYHESTKRQKAAESERQKLAEYDRHRITIQGRVFDNHGLPIDGIEVDLIPVLAEGKSSHWVADPTFTDENGQYTLRPFEGGKFILSIQGDAPPNTQHPFLFRYYPDARSPKHAEAFDIVPSQHRTMNPIRLQRLELGKVPLSVFWSDGTPEPDVFFSFMNTSYPKFGAIGEMMPAAPDGTVSLPVGFEYLGTVKTDCAKGDGIESVFTTGWTFSLKTAEQVTKPLRIVLPGNPCRKWHSK